MTLHRAKLWQIDFLRSTSGWQAVALSIQSLREFSDKSRGLRHRDLKRPSFRVAGGGENWTALTKRGARSVRLKGNLLTDGDPVPRGRQPRLPPASKNV